MLSRIAAFVLMAGSAFAGTITIVTEDVYKWPFAFTGQTSAYDSSVFTDFGRTRLVFGDLEPIMMFGLLTPVSGRVPVAVNGSKSTLLVFVNFSTDGYAWYRFDEDGTLLGVPLHFEGYHSNTWGQFALVAYVVPEPRAAALIVVGIFLISMRTRSPSRRRTHWCCNP